MFRFQGISSVCVPFVAPFLIQLCPGRVLILFAVLVYSLFLVPRVCILFLVPFCSNLALFMVCSYSILILGVLVLFLVLVPFAAL